MKKFIFIFKKIMLVYFEKLYFQTFLKNNKIQFSGI